jgi:hypothetical protein
VQERDPPAVGATLQRAEHRHDRRDPGAAGDEQHVLGHPVREHEVTLGLREVDHRAGAGPLDQVARDHAFGVGPQGDREPVTGARVGAGDGEDPRRPPGPVDLDTDLHVLSGPVTLPRRGRLEGDGGHRRVAGDVDLAVHVDDARPDLVGRPHRVDLLEVAVHALGRGERGDRTRAEDGGGQSHGCLLVVVESSLSERLYTETVADVGGPVKHPVT